MAREIRITIDDDEVFEQMKRAKQELDLSWREVLHRGLQREPARGREPSTGQDDYNAIEDDIGDRIERQVKERIETSLENALGIETYRRDAPGRPPNYEDEVESQRTLRTRYSRSRSSTRVRPIGFRCGSNWRCEQVAST
ncbi:hypothetical protein [Halovenus salina]|uniref:Ribbon-helix-helix protein, copG family n=1 Tax=Halovenus salina TaxID=1510225 RepID=A0ABD5W0E1_9EURY